MRELPRQLSEDELAGLFEGRTRFVARLAAEPDPLTRAATLVHELPHDEQVEVLAAHPAIGQRGGLSARSAAEQGAGVGARRRSDAVEELAPGIYRLAFAPPSAFFRAVELEIELSEGHYHVPLIVSPYSCASYRGS